MKALLAVCVLVGLLAAGCSSRLSQGELALLCKGPENQTYPLVFARISQFEPTYRGPHPTYAENDYSYQSGWIVYPALPETVSTDTYPNWKLFVLEDSQGEPRQLTFGEGGDRFPSLSPDGERVVFSRFVGEEASLFLMDIKSKVVKRLTTPEVGFSDQYVSWSPDGRYLTFVRSDVREHFGPERVMIFDTQTSALGYMDAKPGFYRVGGGRAWSTDGQWLVFSLEKVITSKITELEGRAWGEFSSEHYLFISKPDGTGVKQLVFLPESKVVGFEGIWFSPDNSKLVYSYTSTDGQTAKMGLVDLETGRNREITQICYPQ